MRAPLDECTPAVLVRVFNRRYRGSSRLVQSQRAILHRRSETADRCALARQELAEEEVTFVAVPEGRANSFVGTEEYLAPEVINGVGHTAAVDWCPPLLRALVWGRCGPVTQALFVLRICHHLQSVSLLGYVPVELCRASCLHQQACGAGVACLRAWNRAFLGEEWVLPGSASCRASA